MSQRRADAVGRRVAAAVLCAAVALVLAIGSSGGPAAADASGVGGAMAGMSMTHAKASKTCVYKAKSHSRRAKAHAKAQRKACLKRLAAAKKKAAAKKTSSTTPAPAGTSTTTQIVVTQAPGGTPTPAPTTPGSPGPNITTVQAVEDPNDAGMEIFTLTHPSVSGGAKIYIGFKNTDAQAHTVWIRPGVVSAGSGPSQADNLYKSSAGDAYGDQQLYGLTPGVTGGQPTSVNTATIASLAPGLYTLFCNVQGHEMMRVTLTVTA